MSRVTVRGSLSRSPVARQMRFAAAVALTRTAQDVKAATQTMLQQKLDQPSRWTLNSVAIKPATKANLTSRVFFKEWAGKGLAAGKYLIHMEGGWARAPKRFERALIARGVIEPGQFVIPADGGSIDLADLSGRRTGGLYQRILSGLQASRDAWQDQTPRSILRRRASGREALRYWVQRDREGYAVAIWERINKKVARPVLIVVGRAPVYEPTLDFQGLAARTVRERWPERMREALDRALASAR